MNDASDPNDVFKVGTLYGAAPPPAPTRNGHNSQVGGLPVAPPAPSNRALEAFIRAVEFAVMEQDPEIAAGFRVRVGVPAPRSGLLRRPGAGGDRLRG